jgi:hypothetical protein
MKCENKCCPEKASKDFLIKLCKYHIDDKWYPNGTCNYYDVKR